MDNDALLPAKRKHRRRTPAWIKSLGRIRQFQWIASNFIALYVRVIWFTGRWTILGEEHPRPYWDENKPFLLGFWHGRILMMPKTWRTKMPMNVLISNHRDGEIISNAIARFGIGSVRGSSTSGGMHALRSMVKAVKAGEALGIAPDGPSGPLMRASEGICRTARTAGVPIIPATYAARSRKVMKSWDRFVLPLPFTKCVIMWGEPIFIDKHANSEEMELARARVEQAITDVTREADLIVGAKPILPPEETAG